MANEFNLREAKKTETREAIHRVAIELFSTLGYSATTVSMVASGARISQRTFFTYYNSKKDIIFSIPETYFSNLINELNQKNKSKSTVYIYKEFLVRIINSPPPTYFTQSDFVMYKIIFDTPELSEYLVAIKQRVADALSFGFAQDMGCSIDDFAARLAGNVVMDSLWAAASTLFPFSQNFTEGSLRHYFKMLDDTLFTVRSQLKI